MLVQLSFSLKVFQANQRKPPAVHETHNQFNKLPKLSPQELSRMKAEKDLRDSQDLALAHKRQDELRQNLLLREQAAQAQRAGGLPVSFECTDHFYTSEI